MTDKKLKQLNKLKQDIECVIEFRNTFLHNSIVINTPQKQALYSILLDKKVRDEWLKINKEFFEKKLEELQEEFDNM